jgi:hypothetical protein
VCRTCRIRGEGVGCKSETSQVSYNWKYEEVTVSKQIFVSGAGRNYDNSRYAVGSLLVGLGMFLQRLMK